MYVVTDGLSGLAAGPDTPGSGHNFLVHNMCRLPAADGTWMIVRGGMGTVSARFAGAARAAGARIETQHRVAALAYQSAGGVTGVRLADGTEVAAPVVLGACDPFRLADIAAADGGTGLPSPLRTRLDDMRRFRFDPQGQPCPDGAPPLLLSPGRRPLTTRRHGAPVAAGAIPPSGPADVGRGGGGSPSRRTDD